MGTSPNPTEAEALTGLRTFLLSVLPVGTACIRGLDNRVPEPIGMDFVVMTPMLRERLSTNVSTYRDRYDRSNVVRVIITPTTHETVLALTPGQPANRDIMALLRFYLGYEGEAHLEMHVRPELMPEPVLMPKQTSLGLTTQLKSSPAQLAQDARVTRVHLGRWNGSTE